MTTPREVRQLYKDIKIKLKGFSLSLLAFLFILFLTNLAKASVFCVNTSDELQSALTSAASNEEDDVIKIVQGVYNGNFVYASHEGHDLTIEGGYTKGCVSRIVDATNTVLNGQPGGGTVLVLSCDKKVSFFIEGITVKEGAKLGDGGGLFVYIPGGTLTLINNTIRDNSTTGGHYGGGLYAYAYGATVSLTNNTIIDNSSNDCGGLHICGDTVTLANNTISHNLAKGYYGGGHGGGLCIYAVSQLSLINNIITYNSAYVAGGLSISVKEIAALNNNIVAHNEGGGLSASTNGGTINLTNNTITDNHSTYDNYDGGGVHLLLGDNAVVNIYNNIIFNNIASRANDLAIWNDNDGNYLPAEVNLFNNDFDQSSKGTFIQIPFTIHSSNLDNEDPLFVNPANSDYHIQADSPCINVGDPNAPGLPKTDFEGDSRIVGTAPDIGADEFVKSMPCKSMPWLYLLLGE